MTAPRSRGLAALVMFAALAAAACTSGPQCIINGSEEPVGKPFTLLGCGACTCDASGDVQCENPACSSLGRPQDGAAGSGGSDAEAGADEGSGDGSDGATSD